MENFVWLDAETVKELHEVVLYEGDTCGMNPGSDLEGALNRPRGHCFYGELDGPYELAAKYGEAIINAHAFQDGNKRTAVATIRAFLKANGFEFDFEPHEDEALQMMEDIATGSVEYEEIVDWISKNTVAASE